MVRLGRVALELDVLDFNLPVVVGHNRELHYFALDLRRVLPSQRQHGVLATRLRVEVEPKHAFLDNLFLLEAVQRIYFQLALIPPAEPQDALSPKLLQILHVIHHQQTLLELVPANYNIFVRHSAAHLAKGLLNFFVIGTQIRAGLRSVAILELPDAGLVAVITGARSNPKQGGARIYEDPLGNPVGAD